MVNDDQLGTAPVVSSDSSKLCGVPL